MAFVFNQNTKIIKEINDEILQKICNDRHKTENNFMEIYKLLNISHAVMFHHFHNETHPRAQGSLNQVDFSKMLDWLENNYTLLDANVYMEKALHGSLASSDICLSFDDALLCQIDIALPELSRRNMKAFFFVNSAPLVDGCDILEIFRYFRCVNYTDVDYFYADFFNESETRLAEYGKERRTFEMSNYLLEYKFYSENDRWFRYLRDIVLGKVKYVNLMNDLIKKNKFSIAEAIDSLWIKDSHILDLSVKGHVIGLHSYSHPTRIDKLDKSTQYKEYSKNFKHLSRLIGSENITSMSHPCGAYNSDTISVLNKLGIKIGFRDSMHPLPHLQIQSLFELPREDHANIARQLKL